MKVLIVDDEPLARRGMRREIEQMPGLVIAGEASARDEAVAAIVALQPDIVLLDVQLGRATAFDVIEQIGVDAMPLVIFVTAYDQHALRAFEVNAIDYVLKPVDPDRLRDAVEKAARQRSLEHGASLAERLERLIAAAGPAPAEHRKADRLVVNDGERLSFVDIRTVDWIEASGNYVRVHAGARHYLLRMTMNRMAERVGSTAFVRIRRSALVNVQAIVTVERYAKGMFALHLRSGARLISSRYHQTEIRKLINC
jgi:two-component system, LytTR family, response regulator